MITYTRITYIKMPCRLLQRHCSRKNGCPSSRTSWSDQLARQPRHGGLHNTKRCPILPSAMTWFSGGVPVLLFSRPWLADVCRIYQNLHPNLANIQFKPVFLGPDLRLKICQHNVIHSDAAAGSSWVKYPNYPGWKSRVRLDPTWDLSLSKHRLFGRRGKRWSSVFSFFIKMLSIPGIFRYIYICNNYMCNTSIFAFAFKYICMYIYIYVYVYSAIYIHTYILLRYIITLYHIVLKK